MEEYETFLYNRDIRKIHDCSSTTAFRIMKKIKSAYEIDEDRLPNSKCIPKSVYDDFFKPQKPKRKKKDATQADQSV